MSYQKYKAACDAAGRTIPVDEYLASLSETERREVERQNDLPTPAGQFDLTQPTEDHMEDSNVEKPTEEQIADGEALNAGLVAGTADYPAHVPATREEVRADEPINLAASPEIAIGEPETGLRSHIDNWNYTGDPEALKAIEAAGLTRGEDVDSTVDLAASPVIEEAAGETISASPIADPLHVATEEIPPAEPVSIAAQADRITAAEVAKQIEQAPAEIELPDSLIPVGTEITKDGPEHWTIKLPGQPWKNGKGRSIAGALLDAGIIQ